ncbi:MAG TPA: hypothetical protein VFV69_22990 [Steroidobacteraceae bacterium]|jgi:hypothetical protein|nr:hypothetical protein [Steroidobacteraceae bacterium]
MAAALLSSVSVVAFLCGVSFGAGGWLVDYFTGFRKLGGQLSSWALAAGGAIVLLSMRGDIDKGTMGLAYYVIPLQYVSVVLICWGLLMFIVPVRDNEP